MSGFSNHDAQLIDDIRKALNKVAPQYTTLSMLPVVFERAVAQVFLDRTSKKKGAKK